MTGASSTCGVIASCSCNFETTFCMVAEPKWLSCSRILFVLAIEMRTLFIVGLFSTHKMVVAFSKGDNNLIKPSARFCSSKVRQYDLRLLHVDLFMFSLSSHAIARTAVICSEMSRNIDRLLFHLVGTSFISLCPMSPGVSEYISVCFSRRQSLRLVDWWKRVTILRALPSSRDTSGISNAYLTAKFRRWP